MNHLSIRIAGALIGGLLLGVTVHASGGSSAASPTAPEKTPQQLADQYYNEGLVYRDNAWKLEKKLASAGEADRAKIEKKIRKNYKRAIASYKDALSNNPDRYQAASSLGYALRKTGNYPDALVAYDRALSIEPTYAEAIEYRAEAYLGLNRIDDAKEAYIHLFGSDRGHANELLGAMQEWVVNEPAGIDAPTLEAFSGWIDEREEIAENTTPVSQLREKNW
jgi:tetratricopeptide (TPR) repeat protein